MKKILFLCCLFIFMTSYGKSQNPPVNKLRAPAYPLITIDPYTSAWSFSNVLYGDAIRHWTGVKNSLIGAIRVDQKTYRFMGTEEVSLVPVVYTAAIQRWIGHYTFAQPANGWENPEFNDSSWKTGKAAFGTNEQPYRETPWETSDIWVRRSITLKDDPSSQDLFLNYSHDDVFELYINGIQVVKTGNSWNNNVLLHLTDKIKKSLHKGKNIIAAHCHNTTGGSYVDFGLYRKPATGKYLDLTAKQKSVSVMPTQTYYVFNCGPIQLNLTFCSPLLTDDLKTLSRPVNYISYKTSSLDGKPHNVQIYFEATPEWAVNNTSQEVQSSRFNADGLTFLKTGTRSQHILQTKGDNVRIDWGYFYMAGKNNKQSAFTINDYRSVKKAFATTGSVAGLQPHQPNANMEKEMTALAFSENLGNSKASSGKVMIGYDDIYSVQFYEKNLRAWWRNDNPNAIVDAFSAADKECCSLIKKCSAFDRKLMQEARFAGGENYADLCALAYRQAIAAHKLVRGENGELYFFSKENFSNGSIGTVDVTYPSAPLFLYYNPDLLKGMMDPIFYAAESGKWNKPFPAHDSGTYPLANGQTYGEDMPVEEAGNMLILTAAIAKAEQNASYAEKHWQSLTTWADYLLQKGLDPENQLCTDDFAGHLAHNTNLSVKAIVGIAGYGHMAQMLGKDEVAQKYLSAAKEMAQKWTAMADAGDHFSLTFDKKDTWSQKYNMVWDKLLGYELFPSDLINREIAYYLTKQNRYGLPLDSRATYTKSDWITWTATLADDQDTFEKLIDPVYNAFNESTSRIPMTDWYQTTDAKQVGFQARSVVGGYFIKMLKNKLNLQK